MAVDLVTELDGEIFVHRHVWKVVERQLEHAQKHQIGSRYDYLVAMVTLTLSETVLHQSYGTMNGIIRLYVLSQEKPQKCLSFAAYQSRTEWCAPTRRFGIYKT
jgi:hypothetical protein